MTSQSPAALHLSILLEREREKNATLQAQLTALREAAQVYLSAPNYDDAEEAIELEALLEVSDE